MIIVGNVEGVGDGLGGIVAVAVAVAVGVGDGVTVGEGVEVGVGLGVGLHLPALPAPKIAAISAGVRARLKYSTSSMSPEKNCKGQPHPGLLFWMTAPMMTGSSSPSLFCKTPVGTRVALVSSAPSR